MKSAARSQRASVGFRSFLAALSLAIFFIGCGPILDPPALVGGCTLQVERKDPDGSLHVLVPPFVVPYAKDRGAVVVMRGQSWAHVHVTQADGAGTVRRNEFVLGVDMARGAREWVLDVVGPWRFHLEDDGNRCVADFTIEARPS
jgi:hypothetical protein